MDRRGESARAALTETAERLFAERGIEGVSLRDVSAAAGQRNHSAAQYHFGDRRGLVAAVYTARMGEIDRLRQARLDELAATDRMDDLPALVGCMALPLIEVVATTNGWYARFLARTRWDPMAMEVIASLPTAAGLRATSAAIERVLSGLPRSIRRHRLEQMLTLGVGTLAGWEGAPDRGEPRLSRDRLAAEVIATTVAVLTAVPTALEIGAPA